MTNANIILFESVKLMERGILKWTGEFIDVEVNGEVMSIKLPEEIHTFNGWKERGFVVKRGEKSKIKFPIWKYTSKEKKEEQKTGNEIEDAPITNMFMKMSAFFTADQVEEGKG
jgi:hypothetical protein